MMDITFRYKDQLSNFEWRIQTCHVESVEECIRIYGLNECEYEILKINDPDRVDLSIYKLKDKELQSDLTYGSLSSLAEIGISPKVDKYEKVYSGVVGFNVSLADFLRIYESKESNKIQTSDVLITEHNGNKRSFYRQGSNFIEFTGFFDKTSENEIDDLSEENSEWEKLACKEIRDFDDLITEYSIYKNNKTGKIVAVYGDSELYKPEDEDYDQEFDSIEEAMEWFDSYQEDYISNRK